MAISNNYTDYIETLLSEGRVNDAITSLRKEIADNDYVFKDRLDKIANNYKYLLKSLNWLREGKHDAQRNKILNSIKESLFSLLADLSDRHNIKDNTSLYYTQKRLVEYSGLNYSEAIGRFLSADAASQLLDDKTSTEYSEAIAVKNMALKDLFSILWTSDSYSISRELESIENVILDEDISYSLRCILLGALIIRSLRNYDNRVFICLLNIFTKSTNEKMRARAMVGIALLLDRYPKRIEKDEEICNRIGFLSDDLTFYTRLRETLYSLVRSRGGNKFNTRLKEEILPDLQKLAPDIIKKMRADGSKIDIEKLEENPEWEKIMSESGLEKNMRKFSDMASNGADMMLSMFESVSRNFFFNDIDSWFRPFETWELDRLGVPENLRSMLDILSMNPTACDSDRFAMATNLRRMPASAMDMLNSTLEAHSSQIAEEMKELRLHSSIPDFELETYNFARTLYRFFTFFRYKEEFFNPFEKSFAYSSWPFCGEMMTQTEIATSVADYYFKQGFLEDAISEYKLLASISRDLKVRNLAIQKIGLAFERSGEMKKALDYFLRAFDETPDDEWLAGKIVRLCHRLKEYPERIFTPLMLLYSKDKNNPKYLIPLAEMEISGKLPKKESGSAPYKFFDRAVYLFAEEGIANRLKIKKWLFSEKCEESENAEIREIAVKMHDNAEMYLASESLKSSMAENGATEESDSDFTEVKELMQDELYVLCHAVTTDSMGEALDVLRVITRLNGGPLQLDELNKEIVASLGTGKLSESIKESIPLLMDALDVE